MQSGELRAYVNEKIEVRKLDQVAEEQRRAVREADERGAVREGRQLKRM